MSKRNCCSSSVIENQYLMRMIPERISIRSNSGTERRATTIYGGSNEIQRGIIARKLLGL